MYVYSIELQYSEIFPSSTNSNVRNAEVQKSMGLQQNVN